MMHVPVRTSTVVDSGLNVMAHGDAREGKWRGNWQMEWVASTLHTTSEHGVSSITTADAHTSAASSRLNWRSRWFRWTRPFRRKKKSGFCTCAITFQLASTHPNVTNLDCFVDLSERSIRVKVLNWMQALNSHLSECKLLLSRGFQGVLMSGYCSRNPR